MKIDESLKKEIEEEMEKIQAPSSLYEFAKNIKEESKNRMETEKPRRKKGWRVSHFVAVALISLSILTGSAFLNPTMAEVLSRIPYLGQVFHKPIQEVIMEVLVQEGVKPVSIGMGMWQGKPHFDIELNGTEEYVSQEEDNVLRLVTETLKKRGYDNYELKVSAKYEESPVMKEINKQREDLAEKLMRDLQVEGYPIMIVNAYSPVVKVYIPIADEDKQVEVYRAAIELLKANGTPKQVQIVTKDVSEEEIKSRWAPAMRSIGDEFLLKKKYQVADIRYSFKTEKVTITVKTNMILSDPETNETVNKIQNGITEFLKSDEVKKEIENQPYEIIIQDKNGKLVNDK